MTLTITMSEPATYNLDTHRLRWPFVAPTPGNTLVLILMANGSYANVDPGPLAGQYDGMPAAFVAQNLVALTTTMTTISTGGTLGNWPSVPPTYPVYIEEGAAREEEVTVTAIDRVNNMLTVIRSATPQTHPRLSLIEGSHIIDDNGYTPPLLYTPGDPTQAPARASSWWAQATSTSTDPSMSGWQSRYWQSAPTSPAGHPTWATLCMLARRVDGTEIDIGLIDPVQGMMVELQGNRPDDFLMSYLGFLLEFTPTVEILPLPEVFGDIRVPPDLAPTAPIDPNYPPYAWTYPLDAWLPHLVGSLPNNDTDLWLPILVSSKRSEDPDNAVRGWTDTTGGPTDNPVSFFYNNNVPHYGHYAVQRQIGDARFTVTHNPNPITYELERVGFPPAAIGTSSAGTGHSRLPCPGQHPWWELAFKEGSLEFGTTSVTARMPATSYSRNIHTGDVMLLIAQSDGQVAPADPAGWTRIDALSGPNAYGGVAVPPIQTTLGTMIAAGATRIWLSMNSTSTLTDPPLTVVIAAASGQVPPPGGVGPPVSGDWPGETVTASSYFVDTNGLVALELTAPLVGSHPISAPATVSSTTPTIARHHYIGVWWKIATGPPPDGFGVPALSDESIAPVTFPDATRCSARLFGTMAEPTDPFSPVSPTLPGFARLDYPAPSKGMTSPEVAAEDGVTLRIALGLGIGTRKETASSDPTQQDILDWSSFQMTAGPTVNSPPGLPQFSWYEVEPDAPGATLMFALRGMRVRPAYPLIDGHYAPNADNRGVLPPCAAGGLRFGTDMRAGYGLQARNGPTGTGGVIVFNRAGMSGNLKYLRAWVYASQSAVVCEGEIRIHSSPTGPVVDSREWFSTTASPDDEYIDGPADEIITDEQTFDVRITVLGSQVFEGYYGFLAWSEEDCQPSPASHGLTAAFRFREKELHMPSTQQASIVG